MQTYQNVTDHPLVIPNVGVVPPQGTINTEIEINSAHLKPIINQPPAASAPVQTPPQPVQVAPELPKEGEN